MRQRDWRSVVWPVAMVGFIGAIVALPFVLFFASHDTTAIAVECTIMFGSALVGSVICYGPRHMATWLLGALVVATPLALVLRALHVHLPPGVIGIAVGLAFGLGSRRKRATTA
jgi:hypothetical protein